MPTSMDILSMIHMFDGVLNPPTRTNTHIHVPCVDRRPATVADDGERYLGRASLCLGGMVAAAIVAHRAYKFAGRDPRARRRIIIIIVVVDRWKHACIFADVDAAWDG